MLFSSAILLLWTKLNNVIRVNEMISVRNLLFCMLYEEYYKLLILIIKILGCSEDRLWFRFLPVCSTEWTSLENQLPWSSGTDWLPIIGCQCQWGWLPKIQTNSKEACREWIRGYRSKQCYQWADGKRFIPNRYIKQAN